MTYRGANAVPTNTPADIERLVGYGANLVRFQIAPYPTESQSDYLNQVIQHTARLLEIVAAHPFISYIAELHRAAPMGLGQTKEAWDYLDSQFRDNTAVIGYGLLNEPPFTRQVAYDWQLYLKQPFIQANKKILVSSAYGDPQKQHTLFTGEGHGKLWYETHMYLPLKFTHQGIYEYPTGLRYPTERLNKAKLKSYLSKVRQFQLTYGVRIFCGEFAVSQFTDMDSRVAYLTDLIDVLEEWGWNWAALTFGAEMFDYPWSIDGEVLEVLKQAWQKNVQNT